MKTDYSHSPLHEVLNSANASAASRTPDILVYQLIDLLFPDTDSEYTNDSNSGFEQSLEALRRFIDVHYQCQKVLGEYWDTITSQQQKDFALAFCDLMLYSQGHKLIQFLNQQQIQLENVEIHSINHSPTSSFATVELRLQQNNGETVDLPVHFHFVLGEWKLIDISLDGNSLLDDYRTMFMPLLSKKSFSDLIDTLVQQREQLQVA